MSWYDTFQNTKINYFLFPMTLAFGPLLYFYVRSVTSGSFVLKKSQLWHFVPLCLYLLYRFLLYIFDVSQSGFAETQNGVLMSNVEIAFVSPLLVLFSTFHLLLYLAFTIQLFWFYRLKIREFYSDTYRLELNWIRNFLVIFGLLFIYDVFQNVIDSFILELHWTQKWRYHALSSMMIIYFGIKGYFTNTYKLQDFNFTFMPIEKGAASNDRDQKLYLKEVSIIKKFMAEEKPFLNSSLNLSELSKQLQFSSSQLSAIINEGFGMNFNDFINTYRVEAVKKSLDEKKHESHSLVGIAYDSGFNSKATFNRVFKKLTGISPSEYISNQ
jgi:AraC-like DNA-binding protein